MNQRYGAWAQLLVLFRLFHDGAEADGLQLPRRLGVLFDPDRFPFLEGRRARRGAPGSRARRAAAGPRRHRLPGPRQAAGAGRRAHLLPRPRRRADRLGLRDDDGVPHRDGDGPLGGDQGAEEAGRADYRRPRGAARRGGRQARQVAARPDRPRADRPGAQAGGGGGERRRPARGPAARHRRRRHPRPRAGRGDGAAAQPGPPPLGVALHAARADRAHRAHRPRADPGPAARPPRRAAHARGDPRPEGLRPGDGLGGLPRRGVPAARRRAARRVARPRRGARDGGGRRRGRRGAPPHRPALPLRRRPKSDGRRPSPRCRCGWPRWRRSTR